jgi:hypothetical protein
MACNTLQTLLKLMILVGATIAVFGQGYSQLLLHLYGGMTLKLCLPTVRDADT